MKSNSKLMSNENMDEQLLIRDMQQALKVLRNQNEELVHTLKEINHKATTVIRHGAIDKQLLIDTLGRLAKKALIEIGAVDKVI